MSSVIMYQINYFSEFSDSFRKRNIILTVHTHQSVKVLPRLIKMHKNYLDEQDLGYEAVQVAEGVGKRESEAAGDHHEHEPGVHGDVVLAGEH